jgi:hypothetical protein
VVLLIGLVLHLLLTIWLWQEVAVVRELAVAVVLAVCVAL